MGLRIQNNVEAFNAHRQLLDDVAQASKSMEKLSSGYPHQPRGGRRCRPRHLREDARADRRLAQAQRNAQDGISLVQTAEGSLTEVHSMLQRVRDLKVQHGNGTLGRRRSRPRSRPRSGRSVSEIKSIVRQHEVQRHQAARRRQPRFTFQVGANDSETISTGAMTLSAAVGSPARRSVRARWPSATASAKTALSRAPLSTIAEHRQRDQERLHGPRRPRRGPEPPRAPSEQPGDLPGEPDGVRVAYPRRGHGGRDDQVHQARHPAAGRHVDAGAGQPGPAERPQAAEG